MMIMRKNTFRLLRTFMFQASVCIGQIVLKNSLQMALREIIGSIIITEDNSHDGSTKPRSEQVVL
jgi:hypothetical protein